MEPRRVSDPAQARLAATSIPADPRTRGCRVSPLRLDPQEYLPQRAGPAVTARRAAGRARTAVRRSADRGRGVHRVDCQRPGGSPQSPPDSHGRGPCAASSGDDARGTVQIPVRCEPGDVSADERQLRAAGSTPGPNAWPTGEAERARLACPGGDAGLVSRHRPAARGTA